MKKGLTIPIMEVFGSLAIIAFMIMIMFMWKGIYFEIQTLVQAEENQRRIVTLAQIFLSSPRLVIFEDERALRAMLDPAKLDGLVQDSQILYQEVGYLNATYEFTIRDLVNNNNVWSISPPGNIVADEKYERKFPLVIKYSDNEINPGLIELKYYTNRST